MRRRKVAVFIPLPAAVIGMLEQDYEVIALPDLMGSASDPKLAQAEVVVTNGSTGIDAVRIAAMPNLKLICSYGAGYEGIDLDAARARRITVSHGPGLNDETVADHAFALMLAIARDLPARDALTRQGQWDGIRSARPTLTQATLGIVGMGNIGQAIARRASGFGMRVAYTTRRPRAELPYHYLPDAVQLARQSEYLILACPGGPATYHLVDGKVLSALGPNGFLINVSRGSVVCTEALVHALQTQAIAGAALDVWEEEPKLPRAFREQSNIILSPHMAGRSPHSQSKQADHLLQTIHRFFDGQDLVVQLV